MEQDIINIQSLIVEQRQRAAAAMPFLTEAAAESARLDTPLHIISDETELPEGFEEKDKEGLRDGTIKAWFNPGSGEVYVFAPNCTSKADAMVSVWHEVVAHKGMRGLLGSEAYGQLCELVYNDISRKERHRLLQNAYFTVPGETLQRMFTPPIPGSYADLTERQRAAFATDRYVARRVGDEYIAKRAERGDFTDISLWHRIKEAVLAFARRFGLANKVTDTDIRAMLSNSYNRLRISDTRNNHIGKREKTKSINSEFNEKLLSLTSENADKTTLFLGMPNEILLSAGVEYKPMKLYGNKVMKKLKQHGFRLEDLKNLPQAISSPIAVFDNYRRPGNRSILTELETKEGNVLVAVDLGGGVDIDFNVIRSVFGKTDKSLLHWINNNLATYINKEKVLRCMHLSTPIVEASNNEELISAAKVIKDFKNPPLPDIKNIKRQNVSSDLLFRIGEKRKAQMREGMTTKLTAMSPGEIERNIREIERLGESSKKGNNEGNPKLEKAAYHWLLNGSIRLPEDGYKVLDALSVAEKKGIDPLGYASPLALMDVHIDTKPSLRKTAPDTISVFSDKRELPYGVTTYEVADTREGQAAVRQMIDEHWGADANPWCLAARENGSLEQAWEYWNHYNAYPKRIVFREGKLLCFCANEEKERVYWDRLDGSHKDIPIEFREKYEDGYRSVVREMSEDGKLGKPCKMWKGNRHKGNYKEWFSDGTLAWEENRDSDGKLHGQQRIYFSDGNVRFENNHVNNLLHGRQLEYDNDGTLLQEINYNMGRFHGSQRDWNSKGNLIREEFFNEGCREGFLRSWDWKGRLIREALYHRGEEDGVSRAWGNPYEPPIEKYWIKGERYSERAYVAKRPAEISPELREYYTLPECQTDGVNAIRSGDTVRIYQKDSVYAAELLGMGSRVQCKYEPGKLAERSITFSAEEFYRDIIPRLAARGTEVIMYNSSLPSRAAAPDAAQAESRTEAISEEVTAAHGRGR